MDGKSSSIYNSWPTKQVSAEEKLYQYLIGLFYSKTLKYQFQEKVIDAGLPVSTFKIIVNLGNALLDKIRQDLEKADEYLSIVPVEQINSVKKHFKEVEDVVCTIESNILLFESKMTHG